MEFLRLLMQTYRLPTIGKVLRPQEMAMFAQMQPGQGAAAAGGSPLNILQAGQGEAGSLAGQIEPRIQGIGSAAPTPGHIAGNTSGRIY